ncbi:MAG: putative transport system permease protein [Acidobacteriota bacterium]
MHEDRFAFQALPLTEVLALQMFPLRIASWIGALLAATAVALSVSGLYGVLTYMLSQRTREIGIRMALGATSARVLRLVLRQCIQLASLGVVLGIVLGLVLMRALSSAIQMRNVSVVNASAFVAAVTVVSAAALLSAYVPARRATRIDPSQALRAET